MQSNRFLIWRNLNLLLLTFFIFSIFSAMASGGDNRTASGKISWFGAPGDYVIDTAEPVLRVVIMFDQKVQLQSPWIHYEVCSLPGWELVARGSSVFHPTTTLGGWSEISPRLPDSTSGWYALKLGIVDGELEIPLSNPNHAQGEPVLSFGIMPTSSAAGSEEDAKMPKTEKPRTRKVMAFYYTWYGNPEVSRRWVHWGEGGHNPERLDAEGLPDLGAAHHPVLGPYDSYDPQVIQRHLQWAEEAGIDVLIATWWGRGDFTDRILSKLLDAAATTSVRIALYYESVPQGRAKAALDDLRYILKQYGDHPGYFRHQDAPVVFLYGRALGQLSYAKWQELIEKLKTEHPVTLIADSTDEKWAEICDGLHTYNPVGRIAAGEDMTRFYDSLVGAAERHGKISSVTVIPGYDDSNIGRPSPVIAPRRGGQLYDELWQAAIQCDPDWVLITSFNEWHEGSEVEPSVEYGDEYIRRTAKWVARFYNAPARTLRLEELSLPVIAPSGQSLPFRVVATRLVTGPDPVEITWSLPEGWSFEVEETEIAEQYQAMGTVSAPQDAAPGEIKAKITLSLAGYELSVPLNMTVISAKTQPFESGDVWVELGEENREYGLVQRDQPDGKTEPVRVSGSEARRTIRGVSDHKYMYFDIADQFLFDVSSVEVIIAVEYLDRGRGSFQLQYDSHNPAGALNGAYTNTTPIALRDSGEWRTSHVTLKNARFANRQNGGTDFRLCAGTGELIVKRVSVQVRR